MVDQEPEDDSCSDRGHSAEIRHPTDPKARRDAVRSADAAFSWVLLAITLAMAWTMWAFSGAILWAIVLSVTFAPLNDRLLRRWPGRSGRAAAVTLLAIVAGIIVPAALLIDVIVGEAAGVLQDMRAGRIDPVGLYDGGMRLLPTWLRDQASRNGFGNLEGALARTGTALKQQFSGVAGHILTLGSHILTGLLSLIVTLGLTFFLLRDGRAIAGRAGRSLPLDDGRRSLLETRFVQVVRATMKGTVVLSGIQGVLGGIVMAVLGVPEAALWAFVMAFAAMVPAVGAGLVWVPVSIYLLATGETWRGIAMAVIGALVIGNVDNVLRPVLVGRDTHLPGVLVLLSTLGGLAAFGLDGLILGPVVASLFLAAWGTMDHGRSA